MKYLKTFEKHTIGEGVDIKDTITYNVTNVPIIKFLVNLFSTCINSKLF